jgi:hypothetical protein
MKRSKIFTDGRTLWLSNNIKNNHRPSNPLKCRSFAYTAKAPQSKTRFFLGFSISVFLLGVGYALNDSYSRHDSSHDPERFSTYILSHKKPYSSNSSLFTLTPKSPGSSLKDIWTKGLWSAEIKQPQLQIARDYTPLPRFLEDVQSEVEGTLQFWIRREQNGEVSNYLHRLEIGAPIDVRLPKIQYELPDANEIIFLAGGTGIVPALQLLHTLVKKRQNLSEIPSIHVLWANRRREDCLGGQSDKFPKSSWFPWFGKSSDDLSTPVEASPIVRELNDLKTVFQGKLKVDYYVDEEATFISPKILQSRLSIQSTPPTTTNKSKLVLVCGPDGFVNYFAGPKRWENRREVQGEISGLLKDASKHGWKVWKL